MRSFFALLIAVAVSSCSLDEVSLDGKGCPCAAGWRCDDARDVCVRRSGDADAGETLDGGHELDGADRLDGGARMDAPSTDAGEDSGTSDASAQDAGHPPIEEGVSYRSIGAAGAPLFSGVASARATDRVVTVTAALPARIGRGDRVRLGTGAAQEIGHVRSVLSSTSLLLELPLARDHAGVACTVERAYTTITAWESDRGGDLAGESRREVGVAWDDATFTESVIIAGSTTDADHYLELTAAPEARHQGRERTGVVISPAVAAHAIAVGTDYTRISWLEITDWSVGAAASLDGINITASNVLVEHVIVHDDGSPATETEPDCNGITVEANFASATVRNSLVYRVARAGVSVHSVADATLVVENVTAFDCVLNDVAASGYGCIAISGNCARCTLTARNVLALNPTGLRAFHLSSASMMLMSAWGPDTSHNVSDDDTAPGTSSLIDVLPTAQVVSLSTTAPDLHLRSGADAIDRGANLGSDFTDDIDGDTRTAPWDVGADER